MTKPMHCGSGRVSHRMGPRAGSALRAALLCLLPSIVFPSGRAFAQEGREADTPPTGSLYGRVLSAEAQTPLEGASVEIRFPGTTWFVITDAAGAYRVSGLPSGPVLVVARALDRAPLQTGVVVPPGREVSLELALERQPVVIPSLFARVFARRLSVPGMTRDGFRNEGETELRALDSSPGVAEAGLTVDGRVVDPNDPASILYVRGAASDLKLVLLDGAPVYAPFHLSGLLDAFPDGVLEDASLYIGGTPARYDGGLSYVLDLEIREGDDERFRTAGQADLLGGGGRLEGPIGNIGRVLVSGRALHGLGYSVITDERRMPYEYGDVLGRIDARVGPGTLSGTGFWNRESVLLDIGRLEDTGAVEAAHWGNLAGSLSYRVPVAEGTVTLRGAYGRFGTGLPLPRDKELDARVFFADALGRTSRSRAEAFFESGGRTLRWAAGGGFDTHETALDQRNVLGGQTAHVLTNVVTRANVTAAWGELIWSVAPEVEVRGGARASYFAPATRAKFAPRATLTWHITEGADLRLSAGRFFQIVRGPESILSGDLTGPTVGRILPAPDSLPSTRHAVSEVAGASHIVVGFSAAFENGVDIGFEGYFKSFEDLPNAAGLLFSSGGDFWVQAKEGPVRGWVGYSLGWVWTNDPEEETPFVGRQLLSGGLSAEARNFDFGLRLAYGAGLPFATVTEARDAKGAVTAEDPVPTLSGAPEDSYLRVDAEVSRRWVASVGDAPLVIAPYVRVLNALDRRDALFYRAGPEEGATQPVPLGSLPIIAVLGVAWSF